ncbi:MAG: hypothetical protein V1911_02870 [Candidatus Micrarchaeota archaeon]
MGKHSVLYAIAALVAVLALTAGCAAPGEQSGKDSQTKLLDAIDNTKVHDSFRMAGTYQMTMGDEEETLVDMSGDFEMYKKDAGTSVSETDLTDEIIGSTHQMTYIMDGKKYGCIEEDGIWVCVEWSDLESAGNLNEMISPDPDYEKDLYEELIDNETITFTADEERGIAGRTCDCLTMEFDPEKIADIIESLYGAGVGMSLGFADAGIGGKSASTASLVATNGWGTNNGDGNDGSADSQQEGLQKYEITKCLDRESGQALYIGMHILFGSENDTWEVVTEISADEFEENPSMSDDLFELPAEADDDSGDEYYDCGTSITCMQGKLESCTPAKATISAEDGNGLGYYSEIMGGGTEDACEVYTEVTEIDPDYISSAYSEEYYDSLIGMSMVCTMPTDDSFPAGSDPEQCEGELLDAIMNPY